MNVAVRRAVIRPLRCNGPTVDVGAIETAKVLHTHHRRIDQELTVMPRNGQVAVSTDEAHETIGGPANQAVGPTTKTESPALVWAGLNRQSHSRSHDRSLHEIRFPTWQLVCTFDAVACCQ